jgi:hypothetical protein
MSEHRYITYKRDKQRTFREKKEQGVRESRQEINIMKETEEYTTKNK